LKLMKKCKDREKSDEDENFCICCAEQCNCAPNFFGFNSKITWPPSEVCNEHASHLQASSR
jgi:hypothetical protein